MKKKQRIEIKKKYCKIKKYRKINKIKNLKKIFNLKKTRHLIFNNKSYFPARYEYKKALFNRFSRKLIRRIVFSSQFKIIRKIKERKIVEKRKVVLNCLSIVLDKVRIKLVLRRLKFL